MKTKSGYSYGKIINPKTAENQLLGAMVWGLGMALREEGMVDTRYGRVMNANFAEYHIAVNADVGGVKLPVYTGDPTTTLKLDM